MPPAVLTRVNNNNKCGRNTSVLMFKLSEFTCLMTGLLLYGYFTKIINSSKLRTNWRAQYHYEFFQSGLIDFWVTQCIQCVFKEISLLTVCGRLMQESRTLILIKFVILMKISIIFLVRSRWAIIEASGMSGKRAYIRNPLLRTVYSRMLEDERERSEDHSYVSLLRFRRMPSWISISFEPNIFLQTA